VEPITYISTNQPYFPNHAFIPSQVCHMMLSYLPAKALENMSKVSRNWNLLSREENSQRKEIISLANYYLAETLEKMIEEERIQLTDAVLDETLKQFPRATELNILCMQSGQDLSKITDAGLNAIGQKFRFHSFELFGLNRGFVGITQNGLKEFFVNQPNLNNVSMSSLPHVSNWVELIEVLPHLKYLSISSPTLNKATFDLLAENLPKLFGLRLTGEHSVTIDNDVVNQLTAKHPLLKIFALDNCKQITETVIPILQKNCPLMSRVNFRGVSQAMDEKYSYQTFGKMVMQAKSE
jgi:hypothetical protein